jgi:beta-mannosidase
MKRCLYGLLLSLIFLCFASLLPVHSQKTALVAGIVDDSLLAPHEWIKGNARDWSAESCLAIYRKAGFEARILRAEDLTPEGLSRIQVLVIPGDHVYPERGAWGGSMLQAIAAFVRNGGVYVMPVGVSHYVARNIETGARDTGHFGPDLLGLTFDPTGTGGSLQLTKQGRKLGLPIPSEAVDGPLRSLRVPDRSAVLAWDTQYTPALSALKIGNGYVIHCGCGEKMSPAFAAWWYASSAKTAQAAIAGKLQMQTAIQRLRSEGLYGLSLNEADRRVFQPAPSPMQSKAVAVSLSPGRSSVPKAPVVLSLDGRWEMAGREPGQGREGEFLRGEGWKGAIPAHIPCSVHTALLKAGKIPDPAVGLNADIAREQSYREWWFRREFARPPGLRGGRLRFDGVDYSCTVWLNGVRLGRHEGAFGGPDYDVSGLLREKNTLIVRLDPVPQDWTLVFKTNVVYGWHYVNLPSLGIWRSVRLEGQAPVEIEYPFIATRDARQGIVDMAMTLRGEQPRWSGILRGTIEPENFAGKPYQFRYAVSSRDYARDLHLRLRVPDPRLWWPIDMGKPNLYRMRLSFTHAESSLSDTAVSTFGIRTIETRPLPEGPSPTRYNWTFVINGRPMFLKGANWCILDALLRCDRERYARFLTLARDQHIQVLRAWGGGLLETDTFYDLCDRLGIMVYQEFPLTWQKFDTLSPSVVDDIAVRNIRRLRNHPSLLLWGGGNEHAGKGRVIEQLGRLCLEMDGTRPFHRTDPYGGSLHNYNVYWGRESLDFNLNFTAPFIGEFGLSSPPNLESVMRYLPAEQRNLWPPPENGSFIRHTPTYNRQHMEIMNQYAGQFTDTGTMAGLITGMQLAQATGLRHTLERARTRWPDATGACYYKLTDVYPACAWATIDWYGVPKIAYYVIQDAFEPLQAVVVFESLDTPTGKDLNCPVFLLDDAGELKGSWKVVVRAFDETLQERARAEFSGLKGINRVQKLGTFRISSAAAHTNPLLIVAEVRRNDRVRARNVYWLNFRAKPGCLFSLPRARLSMRAESDRLIIRNTGAVPAVGVHFDCPEISDRFRVEDSYFWLDPGEERIVNANHTRSVRVRAWNAP